MPDNERFEDPARNLTPEQREAYWGVDDAPRFLTKEEAEKLLQGKVMPSQRQKPAKKAVTDMGVEVDDVYDPNGPGDD
jgi:hypothetical protein